jgi:hypothetical protein
MASKLFLQAIVLRLSTRKRLDANRDSKIEKGKTHQQREMELEVDGTLPADVNTGLCIENLTWTPEVKIQNSRFERTNTRGLLITNT